MKRLFTCLFLVVLTSACGSGSEDIQANGNENCDFDVSSFVNGPNSKNTNSYWACTVEGEDQAFTFYSDGTGLLAIGGAFTWEQTGCKSIDYTTGFGTGEVSKMEGSTSSGILTFIDKSDDDTVNVSCVLKSL